MKKLKSVATLAGPLMAVLFFNQVCQSQTQAPAPTGIQPSAVAPAAGGAAGVKVSVKFSGTKPVMGKLKREADPYCAKTPMTDEEVVVNPNGTLKNVVVRVIKGAAPGAAPSAQAVVVDQSNCMYRPRVIAGVVGQKVQITNGDPVLHNVHTYVGAATGFNQAQMKGSKPIEKTIQAGVMKFKCDVHPWMTGWLIGNDNPYLCVTGDSGECNLAGLPAGAYTLEAWHEKYGAKTADVTIAAGPATTEFTFSAP